METEVKKTLSAKSTLFLEHFLLFHRESLVGRGKSDKVSSSALIYEKFRTNLEYQEEHLVLKNAIFRIIKRKWFLAPHISAQQLFHDLFNELAWANYLNPESFGPEKTAAIIQIIERYLILLKNVRVHNFHRSEAQKIVVSWMACEINEILQGGLDLNLLVGYAYSLLADKFRFEGTAVSSEDNRIQLELTIFNLIYKPDLPLTQYWLINKIYPQWSKMSPAEIEQFAVNFESNLNHLLQTINHPLRTKYWRFAKQNIAPFILMKNLPFATDLNFNQSKQEPMLLVNWLMGTYDSAAAAAKEKILRGTFRALIFIFITKISLAFLLEIPFDRYFTGEVDYLTLGINVMLPSMLMLIAGIFIKSPSIKNRRVVAESLEEILFFDRLPGKVFSLAEKRDSSSIKFFEIVYSLLSMTILGGVVWLLVLLHFNFLSIALFFLFVSAVSFFAFRIRTIARELAMEPAKDDRITSTIEFIFLPFIKIGKHVSERFARANPFILVLDFIIEAPLKTIIKIFNSWLKFINAKKEEIEL